MIPTSTIATCLGPTEAGRELVSLTSLSVLSKRSSVSTGRCEADSFVLLWSAALGLTDTPFVCLALLSAYDSDLGQDGRNLNCSRQGLCMRKQGHSTPQKQAGLRPKAKTSTAA